MIPMVSVVKKSAERYQRHRDLNNIIDNFDFNSMEKMILFGVGRYNLTDSYTSLRKSKVGRASEKNLFKAVKDKRFLMLPFAVETSALWCEEAIKFTDYDAKFVFKKKNICLGKYCKYKNSCRNVDIKEGF